jgi:hypothetical protein
MRRDREAKMARLTARLTADDAAADWDGAALRARVKIGAALRPALAPLGIDPATVAMLRVSDEAAQELARTPDRPERRAPAPPPPAGERPHDHARAAFEARIDRLARRYRDGLGIDFARSSLAEALAWSRARLGNSFPPATEGGGDEPGPKLCAADLLQKQRQDE